MQCTERHLLAQVKGLSGLYRVIYWLNAILWVKAGLLMSFMPNVFNNCIDMIRHTATTSQVLGSVAVLWAIVITSLLLYFVALGNKRLWVEREAELLDRYDEDQ